jgi:hypothetical protein
MISAQTLRVCREAKPVPTFPDHALAEILQAWKRLAARWDGASLWKPGFAEAVDKRLSFPAAACHPLRNAKIWFELK